LRTTNGGNTWIHDHTGYTYEYLYVYFYNNGIGWIIGTSGVILLTENNGVPVELTYFSATLDCNVILLNWAIASEINNSGFEIERASFTILPFQNWEKIGFVPGHGTTTEKQIYQFIDQPEREIEYTYRLKQIDYDGTFEYSNEDSVEYTPEFSFALEQNYPNPFNPTTKIKYSIPQKDFVTLSVFNSLGERVALLEEGMKEAGYYVTEFNGSNLSSGIYFYTLSSEKFTDTRKMILLK